MECPNGCEHQMEEIKTTKIFYSKERPIVISDLTIHQCPNCGQESIPLASARIIENILTGKTTPTGKFTAELYEISSAK